MVNLEFATDEGRGERGSSAPEGSITLLEQNRETLKEVRARAASAERQKVP
jgi:hypothetical protein